jgi:DMSO/TMAO reductase YedYZ molybdopterin-dependent catalytic subunit
MLRDADGDPVDPTGDWFVHHGLDVETNLDSGQPLPFRTPTERFFVRNHTAAPEIDATTWRLRVYGAGVATPRTYDLDELRALGITTYEKALECTGNGRRLFATQQGQSLPGTPWGLGAIGLATWTGVPLRLVLEDAGLTDDAVQVMATGLDASYTCEGVDHGHVRRPLPIAKALDDVLVAWEMNGAPLPRDHGYPVRLVVPGWVGIASIKWLGELDVQTERVSSPWNTKWYRLHGHGYDATNSDLGRLPVKSALDLPTDARLPAGEPVTLTGRAWAGEAAIERVEVSVDDGPWQPARLEGDNEPSAVTAFSFRWTPERTGPVELRTRATDTLGRTQPEVAPVNDDGYLFWAVVRHPVTVLPGQRQVQRQVQRQPEGQRGLQTTVSDGR